jgi:hypothetical protein
MTVCQHQTLACATWCHASIHVRENGRFALVSTAMNVLFLSPGFPPQFYLFCTALRQAGATVLGLGDTPFHELRSELVGALNEYVHVSDMNNYDHIVRSVGYLISQHGRIDRVDSLNEHWLGLEAALREDFNIYGPRRAEVARNQSKTQMKQIFRANGVACTDGEPVTSHAQVRAFAEKFGFPLVFKPDHGVGAARTFKVSNRQELDATLNEPLHGYVVEAYAKGDITTFDGLTDREGKIIYFTSHVYNAGIMEVVTEKRETYYYSRREIAPELQKLGEKICRGFDIRERFFHMEFFEHDNKITALEVNFRPPGGFTTDLMNFGSDIDVYKLWAKLITTGDVSDFKYERKYHAAHASRRYGVQYKLSHNDLLNALGSTLMVYREMPPVFAGAMGDYVYLLRHADFNVLKEAISLVHAR